jgi:imidazolonepropionase-like amidohydrolase
VLEAAVVTPGLVDAHGTVGLTGQMNIPHDQDMLDSTDPIQPELRALDAYNAGERLIGWVRGFGVTTVHTGHAPGAVVSGQTMVVKTRGNAVEDAVLVPEAMVASTLGAAAIVSGEGKTPGTRGKEVSLLRQKLVDAQAYSRKREARDAGERPGRDLRLEALVRVLNREVPLLVTAQRAQDIVSALRVAKEFNIRLVLDGAAEAYLVIDEIKKAGVPVIVHPTMMRAVWAPGNETENMSFETPAILHAAGIPIALQSGFEDYVPKVRVVLFEAAIAAGYGLPFEAALASITLDAARIIGVEKRVGSLEVGKDGDVALYDGDPFEYVTHCTGVVIDGVVLSEEPH